MAREKLYLRPIGCLYGAPAEAGVSEGLALPLAGGPIAFAAAELIEGAPGNAKRRVFTAHALAESRDADLAALLRRVTAQRPPFAGLSLDRPLLMGIVNVTPDSFSDGGLYDSKEDAIAHAAELAAAGAAIIDIGGESTRPGSDPVEAGQEGTRVLPVIAGLKGLNATISIDTRKASVARAAAKAGVKIFNDVSALTHDKQSVAAVVETGVAVVLMHAQGEPRTMQDNPHYADVVLEVFDYLEARIAAVEAAGIERSRIAADPGLGFGKTLAHNLALLAHTSLFHGLGVPLLIGASRKRFIQGVSGGTEPKDREPGSHAAAVVAAAQGAQILRVHDVAGSRQALGVWRASTFGTEN
ncbi:MAG TPA: dihydropteroate synthase [Methyloceanibacter sp.]|jgi:dihydropteroate synthase|nr:dihydropteroate synthase [Methyloceanibacter sp.]